MFNFLKRTNHKKVWSRAHQLLGLIRLTEERYSYVVKAVQDQYVTLKEGKRVLNAVHEKREKKFAKEREELRQYTDEVLKYLDATKARH
jgi:hypothetical protein